MKLPSKESASQVCATDNKGNNNISGADSLVGFQAQGSIQHLDARKILLNPNNERRIPFDYDLICHCLKLGRDDSLVKFPRDKTERCIIPTWKELKEFYKKDILFSWMDKPNAEKFWNEIRGLAQTIHYHGLQAPIVVSVLKTDNHITLNRVEIGHRRTCSHWLTGTKIPATFMVGETVELNQNDKKKEVYRWIENSQRDNLTTFEKFNAFNRLLDQHKEDYIKPSGELNVRMFSEYLGETERFVGDIYAVNKQPPTLDQWELLEKNDRIKSFRCLAVIANSLNEKGAEYCNDMYEFLIDNGSSKTFIELQNSKPKKPKVEKAKVSTIKLTDSHVISCQKFKDKLISSMPEFSTGIDIEIKNKKDAEKFVLHILESFADA